MGLLNKAEEALLGNRSSESKITNTANNGPHSSSIANKLDPRVDSTKPDTTYTNPTSTTAGSHNPNVANKADPHVDFVAYDTPHVKHYDGAAHSTGPAPATAGPHSSNLANKADPRIDSDMDNRARGGILGTSTQNTNPATTTATTGLGASTYNTGPANRTAGPHKSDLANKADPRVDSDMDNRARAGILGSSTHGTHPATNTATTGLGTSTHTNPATSTGTTGLGTSTYNAGPASKTAGPHKSDMANKADPRVDSDMGNRTGGGIFGSSTHGTNPTTNTAGLGTSTYNTGPASKTAGPHKSDMANKLDPRVDSDLDNGHGTAINENTYSTGPAPSTAGPHSSNLANKIDPRVDSDMDNRARHQALAGSSYSTPAGTTGPTGATDQNLGLADKNARLADSDIRTRPHGAGAQRSI